MSRRWLVERKPDQFEDVGAEHLDIHDGCLVFKDSVFENAKYVVAAGHWVSVVREDDE